MNNDIFEGDWEQIKGEVQKQWGKLTGDHLTQINGSRKKLSGVIQEIYGIANADAERQMGEWEKSRVKMLKSLSA
ncbi:MAG TPA: CsbD family protein [Alphaproteobacteria bacterium]|jgi:uncharacterized protein YjbJ (UPF0337 family)|nr:CsbD family protein [Micavibrio sp.]HRK98435.1 CsbD family protein [Alphaproteobacteria bacterium]